MRILILNFSRTYLTPYLDKWDPRVIRRESLAAYTDRVVGTRTGFSDFYAHHLREAGWTTEQIFTDNPVFLAKLARQNFGISTPLHRMVGNLRTRLRGRTFAERLVTTHIERTKPDVLFVLGEIFSGNLLSPFRKSMLVVTRLSFRMPPQWHPNHWDLVLTPIPEFARFFELHGTRTVNSAFDGFEERILSELTPGPKKHSLAFVGHLDPIQDKRRADLFYYVAENTDLAWWAFNTEGIAPHSRLAQSYRGHVSGIQMYQTYRDSCIVVNDYRQMSEHLGTNLRILDVIGVGSLLLTRAADNLSKSFPPDCFVTYRDEKDCVDKARYFLKNDKEREEIARRGQEFVLKHYTYREAALKLGKLLIDEIENKKNSKNATLPVELKSVAGGRH